MPKRKRAYRGVKEGDTTQREQLGKEEVEKKIVHGRKVLNRALKTARGFEWQKLSKRIKQSLADRDEDEAERLKGELDVLKTLDLSTAGETHLYKTILKSKSICASGRLPEYIKADRKWNEFPPKELATISNVTARLYNTKPVKEALSQIMRTIYTILDIPDPSIARRKTADEKYTSKLKDEQGGEAAQHDVNEEVDEKGSLSEEERPTKLELLNISENFEAHASSLADIESDNMNDNMFDPPSDKDCSREIDVTGHSATFPTTPHQQDDTLNSLSESSESTSLPPKRKKSLNKAQPNPSKSGSTFLPTLMGGYWSGSESVTDDEDLTPRRKNRPGQQARRAMWEKKFGARANHLKGQVSDRSREKDWDLRRGAQSAEDGRFRRGKSGGRGGNTVTMKSKGRPTGENAVVVNPRVRVMGKKDDTGPLHPSWEAAKRAKEAKQTASFLGKKIVFD